MHYGRRRDVRQRDGYTASLRSSDRRPHDNRRPAVTGRDGWEPTLGRAELSWAGGWCSGPGGKWQRRRADLPMIDAAAAQHRCQETQLIPPAERSAV